MKRIALASLLLMTILVACAVPQLPLTAQPTPTTTPIPPTPTATPFPPTATTVPPTVTPIPPTPTPLPVDTAALSAQLMTALYPAGAPADGSGIFGVQVLPLTVPDGSPRRWVVFSTGMNGFMPDEPHHFLALYGYGESGWKELSKIELTDPDYIDPASVQQVSLEPSHIWISIEAGMGAHSGLFNLFMVDGDALSLKLSGSNSSPGVAQIIDLNDDGVLEVVLNATEPYVFCYACNVRLPMFSVYRWTGAELQPVELTMVGDDVSPETRNLNNEMVSLAEAWLWKDAAAIADSLSAHNPENTTVRWNLALMQMNVSALSDEIGVSSFPLLAYVFYGDYDGVLAMMRQYSADELFSPNSPLIADTPAVGWESVLRDWIYQATDLALAKQPDIGTAHFLRAWATFINDGATGDVRAELAAAVQFSPDESLFLEAKGLLGD